VLEVTTHNLCALSESDRDEIEAHKQDCYARWREKRIGDAVKWLRNQHDKARCLRSIEKAFSKDFAQAVRKQI